MEFYGLPENTPGNRSRLMIEGLWEKAYPYVMGCVVLVLVAIVYLTAPFVLAGLGDAAGKLFDGAIGVSSIMAGFTATLLGILFSVRESRKIRFLEQTGHFKVLKRYLTEAIHANLMLCAVSIVCNVVVADRPEPRGILVWIVSSLLIVSILTVTRVTRLMSKLL